MLVELFIFLFSSIYDVICILHTLLNVVNQHMTSTSRNSAIKHTFVTGERVNIDAGTNIEKNKHEN